ncbi:hypothetical protein SLE2022_120590 [Rubroshorea leprosula]
MSCAVDSILYHVHKGVVKLPLAGGEAVRVPGLPPLEVRDMPSFISDLGSYPAFFKMVVHDQFTNVEKADCVLCNTIYELEKEEADYLSNLWPLRTIGPTIPSMFLDKQIEEDKRLRVQHLQTQHQRLELAQTSPKRVSDLCLLWKHGCP